MTIRHIVVFVVALLIVLLISAISGNAGLRPTEQPIGAQDSSLPAVSEAAAVGL